MTDLITGEGAKQLVSVGTDPDRDGDTDWITTTNGHPFWIDGQGWTDAGDLSVDDLLMSDTGELIAISRLDEHTSGAVVHNLTIDRTHTYYVMVAGEESALVHNCGRGIWKVTKAGSERSLTIGKRNYAKSKSDGLWWSRDTAGHGGSAWKVYKETSRGLEWFRDADKYGDFIDPALKHKSDAGMFIPWR